MGRARFETYTKGIQVANRFDPTIDVQNAIIKLGDAVSIPSISTVDDRDGDPIVTYRFFNPNGGGFFTLNGVDQGSGTFFDVDAADISLLRYHASATVENETIRARVYDGERWSSIDYATFYSVSAPTRRPNVSSQSSFDVVAFEKVRLSDYFSARDPDGYPIMRYKFKDARITTGGGYLEINGVKKPQGRWYYVSADKLDDAYYVSARGAQSENVLVRAFDGTHWSDVSRIQANTTRNANRPLVSNATFTIRSETSVSLIDTFEWRDEDTNTIKKYGFVDTNGQATSGYIDVNGQKKPSNQWITINAEDMPNARFIASQGALTENLRVRVFDGKFWSAIKTVEFKSLPDPRLLVENDVLLDEFEVIKITDIITGQADEGPRIVDYEFVDMDAHPLSGYLELDGVRLDAGVIHNFTQAEFNRLNFVGGADHRRSADQIKVRANNRSGVNNFFVGEWKNVNIYTEPNAQTSLIMPNATPDMRNSWHDWITEGSNGRLQITFSFMQQVPIYYLDGTGPSAPPGAIVPTNPVPNSNQRDSIRRALGLYRELLNVDIIEVSDNYVDPNTGTVGGILRFGTYFENSPVSAFAYPPDDTVFVPWGGDIWINNFFIDNVLSVGPGSASFSTILHEIGHTFGSNHPFAVEPGTNKTVLSSAIDHDGHTVMSYTPNPNGTISQNLMLYDVLYLSNLYGNKDTTRTGDDTYRWNAVRFQEMIYDVDGNDTIDASNQIQSAKIDLRQGQYSSIGAPEDNVVIPYGTVIENAIGTINNDRLIGNEQDNVLDAGDGDDILTGGGGADTLRGGRGDDKYVYMVGDNHNIIDEQQKTGRDILEVRLGNRFGLDSFQEDISFQRLGRDLLVEFKTDGDDFRSGSVLIKNQLWGSSRIETLRMFNDDGTLNGLSIDLTSVYVQANATSKHFEPTGTRGQYGFLVQPV